MILFSLYIIVSATLLVQSFHSARTNSLERIENPLQGYQRYAFPQSKDSVRKFVSNKNDVFNKDLFIKNSHNDKTKPKPIDIDHIQNILDKFLKRIHPTKGQKRDAITSKRVAQRLNKHRRRTAKTTNAEVEPQWSQWNNWSCCSVTCGKGREIRWRHCLQNCNGIETEMEEKSCQLPACGGKLFGLIKL